MRLHLNLRRRGIGDTVAASALCRDLVASNPDIRISVSGNSPDDVFRHAPWYAGSDPAGADRVVEIDYKPTIDRAHRPDKAARYIYAAHDAYETATGERVVRGPTRPALTLSHEELERPSPEPYAVLACGSKADIPVKQAPVALFRSVVAETRDWNWKQVGLVFDGRLLHHQTAVEGCANLIGKTDLRRLFRIVAHARVVLCHLSLPMLVASALGVPCVALAGGREDPWLFEGLGVTVIDTIGRLDCCGTRGCYVAAALPRRKPEEFPRGWLCTDPIDLPDERPVGRCMTLLSADEIIAALRTAVR